MAYITVIFYSIRICLDFTANKYYVILFSLFEALFTIFTPFVLANRPLFAATKQCKSAQKYLSTKLEIKSKQILRIYRDLMMEYYVLYKDLNSFDVAEFQSWSVEKMQTFLYFRSLKFGISFTLH